MEVTVDAAEHGVAAGDGPGAAVRMALTQAKPREVGRLYWELIPETEVWVRLIPEDPEGKPPLVNLAFRALPEAC